MSMLRQAFSRLDKVAIVQGSIKTAYFDLFRNAASISSQLCQGGSHRIGLICPSSAEYVTGLLATWKSGNISLPLHPAHPVTEWEYNLKNSETSMVLLHQDLEEKASPLLRQLNIPYHILRNEKVSSGTSDEISSSEWNFEPSDPSLMIYTSGTTGKPKGVVHTHKSLLAQVNSLKTTWEWSETDTLLHTLPLHHIHGIVNGLLCCISAGATIEFLPYVNDGKFKTFDAEQGWKRFMTEGKDPLTLFMGVPAMYSSFLDCYYKMGEEEHKLARISVAGYGDVNKFRLFISGSSPLPDNIFDSWYRLMTSDNDNLGSFDDPLSLRQRSTILERYGMSEVGMALSNPLRGERIKGTVGSELPGVIVKIVDQDGFEIKKEGEVGELLTKSDTLFDNYWNNPEATANSFVNGWFKTGDSAMKQVIDGKRVYKLLGRNSVDILKVSGYKISALDIEKEIIANDKVKAACVFGIPAKDGGDKIIALIVANSSISESELKSWLKNRIAHYKIPCTIHLVPQIPVNTMGKVNKKELAKLYQ